MLYIEREGNTACKVHRRHSDVSTENKIGIVVVYVLFIPNSSQVIAMVIDKAT
jgi:hypothetical protein